jgi:hypothetical protein
MEITLLSTELSFFGIIARCMAILAIIGFIWLFNACEKAPVIKDENMEMSIIAGFAFPHSIFWLSSAIALIAVTVILGIVITSTRWGKVREHFNFKTK